MDRKEAQKKIADIMYHALKGDITEKEMHDQTFEVLKQIEKKKPIVTIKFDADDLPDKCESCGKEY